MSSFNKLLTRLTFLTEASSPMDRILPGFQTQARQYAVKDKGAAAGTREGRLAMLSILFDLDIIDQDVVKRFKNDSGVSRMVAYFEDNGIAAKIKERAEEIQAYIEEHLHNKVSFTTGNRSDEALQKYELNKLDQELKQAKKAARLERKKETAEAISIMAEPVADYTSLAKAALTSLSDEYLLEIVGEKGITLYQITRAVKYLSQFVSEHELEINGRSIDALFTKDSKLGKIVSKIGVDKIENQIRKDLQPFGEFGVVIHEPDSSKHKDMIGNIKAASVVEDEENYGSDMSDEESFYSEEEEEDDFDSLATSYSGVTLLPEIQQAQLKAVSGMISQYEDTDTTEAGVDTYMTEQVRRDSYRAPSSDKTVTFKEKYSPKTIWQLEELRRYGL